MTQLKELSVEPARAGARLDVYLGEALGLSRAKLKRLFDEGAVRVNGRPAKKGLTLAGGEQLRVELPEEAPALVPEAATDLTATILYEDDDVVVLDKPSGVPSHPLRPGETGTCANLLLARYPEMATVADDPREAGLCHRLDVETSGALLAARTRPAWERLRRAFGEQEIDKRYWAMVTGPLSDDGELDLPLRHHPRHTDRVEPAVDGGPEGRPAISRFRVLARNGDFSLVEVRILTGVLHQVRAHLSAVGAPLVGDALYGGRMIEGLSRFFLHARALGFPHPSDGRRIHVDSPLPPELAALLEAHGLVPDAA